MLDLVDNQHVSTFDGADTLADSEKRLRLRICFIVSGRNHSLRLPSCLQLIWKEERNDRLL
jgi:hypothetical protein